MEINFRVFFETLQNKERERNSLVFKLEPFSSLFTIILLIIWNIQYSKIFCRNSVFKKHITTMDYAVRRKNLSRKWWNYVFYLLFYLVFQCRKEIQSCNFFHLIDCNHIIFQWQSILFVLKNKT